MADPAKALQTQIENIQKKTGKSLDQLAAIVKKSGLSKHGEIRDMLKETLGLGHGDANTLVHVVLKSDGFSAAAASGASGDQILDEIYSGPKAALRPIHDKLMAAIEKFGEFEIAPKKGYVSLRRKKQFAMIGPGTNSRVDLGLNVKDLKADPRLLDQGAGKMCNYQVRLADPKEVDKVIVDWLKAAYTSAG